MYEAFFGLRERPFELSPNPRFLLLTSRHSEALGNLEYAITGRKGMALLLGEAGTGKTTIIRTALQKWEAAGHMIVYISNPTLTRAEFVESLAEAFGLGPEAGASKTRMLSALTRLVTRRHEQGGITGLLIDEAQSLSDELLEEIRLLANLETVAEKLFPVVLAGQPELADRLNTAGLRQLKQRFSLRCVLLPLDVRETGAYIAGRIRLGGGVGGQLFTREAVMAIHGHARGIPRVINVICDNALLAAFAANRRPVTQETVEEVCRDFALESEVMLLPADVANATSAEPVGTSDPASDPARGSRRTVGRGTSLFESASPSAPAPQVDAEAPLFASYGSRRRFSFFR